MPYWIFRADDPYADRRRPTDPATPKLAAIPAKPAQRDLTRELGHLARRLTDDQAEQFIVSELGLPRFAVPLARKFGVGYRGERTLHTGPDGRRSARFVIPERNGCGQVVGGSERLTDPREGESSKLFIPGASRGLTYSKELLDGTTGDVWVPEGGSDPFVYAAAGEPSIGRPSANAGAADLAVLMKNHPGRRLVVVPEWDVKPNGSWPGLAGAQAVAREYAATGRPVAIAFCPPGAKDPREYVNQRCGPDTTEAEYRAVVAELLAHHRRTLVEVEPESPADVPEPCLDEHGRCVNLGTISQPGKPGTAAAGRQRFRCLTCKKRSCPGCGPRKAAADHRQLVHAIRTAADPGYPVGPECPAPQPVEGQEAFAHLFPRARLFITDGNADTWDTTGRYIRRHYGEYSRITFAPRPDDDPAIWGDVRLSPSSGVGHQTKSDTLSDAAQPAHPERIRPLTRVIVALPPGIQPPERFRPISATRAAHIAGAMCERIPSYNPFTDRGRFRAVDWSDGWRPKKQRQPTDWGQGTGTQFGRGEIAEIAERVGLTAKVDDHQPGTPEAVADGTPRPLVVSGPLVKVWLHARLTARQRGGVRRTFRDALTAYRLWDAAVPDCTPLGSAVEHLIETRLWDAPADDFADRLAGAIACDDETRDIDPAAVALVAGFDPRHPIGDEARLKLMTRTRRYATKRGLAEPRDMTEAVELRDRIRQEAAQRRHDRRVSRNRDIAALQWRVKTQAVAGLATHTNQSQEVAHGGE